MTSTRLSEVDIGDLLGDYPTLLGHVRRFQLQAEIKNINKYGLFRIAFIFIEDVG